MALHLLAAAQEAGANLVTLTGQPIGLPGTDSDLDGMPDAWEQTHQLNAAAPGDALGDDDHDGVLNFQEYVADTDPANPTSHFEAVGSPAGDAFIVHAPMSTNRQYSLQCATNLAPAVWAPVPGQGPRLGTGAADSMADTNAAAQRFYRLQVALP